MFFLVSLVITSGVNAGFFDFLFKHSDDASKITKNIAKKDSDNLIKKTDDLSKLSKEERMIINAKRGAEWEKAVQNFLCSKKKCLFTDREVMDKISRRRSIATRPDKDNYIIVGGSNTKKFINNNDMYKGYYSKEPDFLEITEENGLIKKVKIIDSKTSPQASRSVQETAFKDLCISLEKKDVGCQVQYAEPKGEVASKDALECFAMGLIFGPDPTDLLCFVPISD